MSATVEPQAIFRPAVVPLKSSDFAEWTKTWTKYLTFYKTTLPEEQHKDTFARLIDPSGDVHGFAIFDGEEMVGLAHYLFHPTTWGPVAKPHCYLNDLYVNDECRGKGYGRALIVAVKDVAKERGCSDYYWTTQHGNATARRLYDKLGTTEFTKYKMEIE